MLGVSLFSVDVSAICLCGWHNHDVVQADVGGTGDGEENRVGDVFVGQRRHSLVNVFGGSFVAFVADNGEFGFSHTRCDVGDLDVVFQHIRPHSSGEGIDGVFGGAVDVSARIYFLAGNGSDVDDVSGLVGYHQRGYRSGHIQQAFDVGVYHAFPVIQYAFLYGGDADCQSGVVDEHGDVAPLAAEAFYGLPDGFRLPDVEVEGKDFHAFFPDFPGERLKPFFPSAGDDDVITCLCGFECRGFSDAGGGSGDECYFVHVFKYVVFVYVEF